MSEPIQVGMLPGPSPGSPDSGDLGMAAEPDQIRLVIPRSAAPALRWLSGVKLCGARE